MSNDTEEKLQKEVDDYLGYWNKTVNELVKVYPKEKRSETLNSVLEKIQRMIKIYSDNSEQDQKIEWDIDTYQFTKNMLRQQGSRETKKEKEFLDKAFKDGSGNDATKLLRFLYMIEYEKPVIHYTLMLKKWLQEDEVTIESYFQSKKEISKQLKDLTKKYKSSKRSREQTDKLFQAYWMHERDRVVRVKMEGVQSKFLETTAVMRGCFDKENEIDSDAKKVWLKLRETLEQMQTEFNKVLLPGDQTTVVDVKSEKNAEDDKAAASMLDALYDMVSAGKLDENGLSQSELKKYQKSKQYPITTEFIHKGIGQVFSNFVLMDNTMKRFLDREDQRMIAMEKMEAWKRLVDGEIEQVIQEEPAKQRLETWYDVSMRNEKKQTVTGKNALQISLQRFITANAPSFTGGVWQIEPNKPIEENAFECLSVASIERFHGKWHEYKSETKGLRQNFKIVNKILMHILVISISAFGAFGVTKLLPAALVSKIAGLVNFGFGTTVIQASMTMAIPIAAIATLAMVVIHIRNARKIKQKFDNCMERFKNPNEEDSENRESQTYLNWAKKGLLRFCNLGNTPQILERPEDEENDENEQSYPQVVVTLQHTFHNDNNYDQLNQSHENQEQASTPSALMQPCGEEFEVGEDGFFGQPRNNRNPFARDTTNDFEDVQLDESNHIGKGV